MPPPRDSDTPLTPTPAEFEVLSALWSAGARSGSDVALRTSQIHAHVAEQRESHGLSPPTPVTVSTMMKGLLLKGLVQVVSAGSAASDRGAATRGLLRPVSRSPTTAYQAIKSPGEVLTPTYLGLLNLYPNADRHQAIIDFVRAFAETGGKMAEGEKIEFLVEIARSINAPKNVVKALKEQAKGN